MKIALRVLVAIISLIAIVAGVRQIASGVRQMKGIPDAPQPQEVGERVAVAAHGCSLRVPRGWTEKQHAAGGTMFVAPIESGLAANFSIGSEPFEGSLPDYADATLAALKTAAPNAKILEDAAFATDTGAAALRVSFSNQAEGRELAQQFFFFDGPAGRKIVATSTSPAEKDAELKPLFEACMKSLNLTAP